MGFLFTQLTVAAAAVLAACSSPSPHKQLGPPGPPVRPDAAAAAPDAAVARSPGQRGEACRTDDAGCAEPLVCDRRQPGGYCASACDAQTACDGACVDTREGMLCAKRCTVDRDCRTSEAYVCDRQWHACLVPNFAAPIAKQCPVKQVGPDAAFAAAERVDGVLRDGIDAVIADNGALVTKLDARLARDRKGTLYALAAEGNGLRLATSRDRGATWSEPLAVHDPGDCGEDACGDPMLVAGGALHVFYAAGANGLRVRTSRDGGKTFTTGPIVAAGTNASALASGDGKLHVVALHGNLLGAYGSAQQTVEYAVSSDGGASFSRPVTVSGRDELLPYLYARPALAADPARRWIYIAYVRGGRDAAWDIVLAASKDGGATWKRTTLAGDGCALHMLPSLAVDAATGTLHVVYYDAEGGPGRLVHAACGPGVTKCTWLGTVSPTPFAGLSLGRRTAASVGYESLVLDDKRRLLHVVWAQPIDEGAGPVVRIFHAAAKLKK
jgi:hypothetical protein